MNTNAEEQKPADARLSRSDSQRSTVSSSDEKASVIDNSEIVAKAQLVQTQPEEEIKSETSQLFKSSELPDTKEVKKVRRKDLIYAKKKAVKIDQKRRLKTQSIFQCATQAPKETRGQFHERV